MSARRAAEPSDYDRNPDAELIDEAVEYLMGVLTPEDWMRLAKQAAKRHREAAE